MKYLTSCVVLFLLFVGQGHAHDVSLEGSPEAVDRAYKIAKSHDYTLVRTPAQLQKFVKHGYLVPVRENANLTLHDVSYAVARPALRLLINRLAAQYRSACGKKLDVTSLTRPKSMKLSNGSRRTVHPAGIAVDLRIPKTRSCRTWLERNLLIMERRHVVEATRERRKPHYHIVVNPTEYLAYLRKHGVVG